MSRSSVAALWKRCISAFFTFTLALGLVPVAAFAVEDGDAAAPQNSESATADFDTQAQSDAFTDMNGAGESDGSDDSSQHVISSGASEAGEVEKSRPSSEGEGDAQAGDSSNSAVLPAGAMINQEVALDTVAQAESTRSFFLAQTLESTKIVPMVSAKLPIDTGANDGVSEDGAPSSEEEGSEGSEGDPGSDDPVDPSFTLGSSEGDSAAVAAESTVVGSFEYRGMTFAIEPGGESVALIAVDYNKLPEEYIQKQVLVIPDAVTPDGVDHYSVTRIADDAFASLTAAAAAAAENGESADADSDIQAQAEACAYGEKATPDDSKGGEEPQQVISGEVSLSDDSSQHVISSGVSEANGVEKSRPSAENKGEALTNSTEAESIGITAITIPASITTIEDDAFLGFDTLQYVIVSEDNPNYSMYDGCLYDKPSSSLLLIPEGRLGAVRIASDVAAIDPQTFSHCAVDTVAIDAGSAASQLLSESDFHNANGDKVEVQVLDEEAAKSWPSPYEKSILSFDIEKSDMVSSIVPRDEVRASNTTGRSIPSVNSYLESGESWSYGPKALPYIDTWDYRYNGAADVTTASPNSDSAMAGWGITSKKTLKVWSADGVKVKDLGLTLESAANAQGLWRQYLNDANKVTSIDTRNLHGAESMAYWFCCGEGSFPSASAGVPATYMYTMQQSAITNIKNLVIPGNQNESDISNSNLNMVPRSLAGMVSYAANLISAADSLMTIPNGVEDIQYMFYRCTKLKTLPSNLALPSSVSLVKGAFYDLYYVERLPENICTNWDPIGPIDLTMMFGCMKHWFEGSPSTSGCVFPDGFKIPQKISRALASFSRMQYSEEMPKSFTISHVASSLASERSTGSASSSVWSMFYSQRENTQMRYHGDTVTELLPYDATTDVWTYWKNEYARTLYPTKDQCYEVRFVREEEPTKVIHTAWVRKNGVCTEPFVVRKTMGDIEYTAYTLGADGSPATFLYEETPVTSMQTVYIAEKFDVEYDSNGGAVYSGGVQIDDANLEPSVYKWSDADALLPEPVRMGYTFDGWVDQHGVNYGAVIPTHSVGHKKFLARWKYKIVLNLNTVDSSNKVLWNSGASVPTNDGVYTENYIDAESGELRTRYCLDAYYGEKIVLPKVVGRTGYDDADSWGVKCGYKGWSTGLMPKDGFVDKDIDEGSFDTTNAFSDGILDEEHFPTFDPMRLEFPAPDATSKAITLFANWAGKAKQYDVTLTAGYSHGDLTFAPTDAGTTTIKAQYDAPLLKEENGAVVPYVAQDVELKAPQYKGTDEYGTEYHEYVFKGYRSEKNGIVFDEGKGAWNGTEYIGSAISGSGSAIATAFAVRSEPYRIDGPTELFALWGYPTSTITLDLQGGKLDVDGAQVGGSIVIPQNELELTTNEATKPLPNKYDKAPVREGYEFAGWWTADRQWEADASENGKAAFATFAETTRTTKYYDRTQPTDATVSPVQVSSGDIVWKEATDTVLYAHWRYTVKLERNSIPDNDAYDVLHKGADLPSGEATDGGVAYQADVYGNRYFYPNWDMAEGDPDFKKKLEIDRISVLAGVPVKLPYGANRQGYDDVCSWSTDVLPDNAEGLTARCLPVDDAGFTLASADGSPSAPAIAPGSDAIAKLYPYWGDSARTYWVKLISSYIASDGFVFHSDADPQYFLVKYATRINGVTVPNDLTETEDGTPMNLTFGGFFAKPGTLENSAADRGTCYVTANGAAGQELRTVGKAIGSEGDTQDVRDENAIEMFAMWTLPVTRIEFNLFDGDILSETAAVDSMANSRVSKHYLDVQTNEPIGNLLEDGSTSSIAAGVGVDEAGGKRTVSVADVLGHIASRTSYEFNGFWTHPYDESDPAGQYYDAALQPVQVDGANKPWPFYEGTTLYAHWKYTIRFDKGEVGAHSSDSLILADGVHDAHVSLVPNTANLAVTAILGQPLSLPYNTDATGAFVLDNAYDPNAVQRMRDGSVTGYTLAAWRSSSTSGNPAASLVPDSSALRFGIASEFGQVSETVHPDALNYLQPSDEDKAAVLRAVWDANEYEAFLVNDHGSFGADPYKPSIENNTLVRRAVYDTPFNSAVPSPIPVPRVNGHTFRGYFNSADADPDAQPQPARQYFAEGESAADELVNPMSTVWLETSRTGTVSLYAAYSRDSYPVRFDLSVPGEGGSSSTALTAETPGTEPVQLIAAADVSMDAWAYDDAVSSKVFPKASASPTVAPFFRNGYDFKGWYYLDDESSPVYVSNAEGTGAAGMVWAPDMAWQIAHKNADDAVHLYAGWTPKTYGLRFYLNRTNATSDVWMPNETTTPNGNAIGETAGVYYYEVAYEGAITPYFDTEGEGAVPSYKAFTFDHWQTEQGDVLFDGMTDEALTLAGTFMPKYPLSAQCLVAGQPVARTVDFLGQWTTPDPVTVTLFSSENGAYQRTQIENTESAQSDESKLVFENVGYDQVLEVGTYADLQPQSKAGYRFAGYVQADENGAPLANPYDDSGELRDDVQKVTKLEELRDPTYLVAVYSRNALVVQLRLPAGAKPYTLVDGTLQEGWIVGGKQQGSTYQFHVGSDRFRLPDSVVVAGKAFDGWKCVSPADAGDVRWTEIDPAAVAASDTRSVQVFEPVLDDRVYKVSFLSNYNNGGAGAEQTAYVDYDGHVLGGTLVDAGEVERGEVLGMPLAPAPDVSASGEALGGAGEDGSYRSYIFTAWRVGSRSAVSGANQAAGSAVTSAMWNGWFSNARYTSALDADAATEADRAMGATDAMGVYGVWDPNINAVCPLFVNLAVDVDTGSVAIPDIDYGLYSAHKDDRLEVAMLRYESVSAVGAAGANPFAQADEPIYLNVFAGSAEKPDLAMPSIEDGTIKGTFGKAGENANPLQIDLRVESSAYSKPELAAHGFRGFSNGNDASATALGKLPMYYGLDLDGVSVGTLRSLSSSLPNTGTSELDDNGWTTDSVPIAKLLYTIQRMS